MGERVSRRGLCLAPVLALVAALTPVVSMPATTAAAAAGVVEKGLDPSFGDEGMYRLDLSEPSLDVANAAAPGGTGVIAAGSAGGRFALGAFDNGTITFNGGRQTRIVDFGRPSAANAIVAPGDRLVVAGSAGDDFALAILAANGDTHPENRIRTSFGAPAVAYGLVALPELRSVAVGTVQSGAGSSVAMAGYDRNGLLIPSFGVGGRVVFDVTPGLDSANAAIYAYPPFVGDQILVAGQAGPDVLLARFHGDGSPDLAFGTGGRVVLDLSPGNDIARSVSFSSGGIIIAGSAGSEAFVAALSLTGTLERGFGDNGVVRTALGGDAATLSSIVWDSILNRIYAGGTTTRAGATDAVIAGFRPDGTVDPGFGSNGRAVVDLGGPSDQMNGLVPVGPTVRLVGGDGVDMVSVSVNAQDGAAPGGTGDYRRLVVDFGPSNLAAGGVTTMADGRIVVAGMGAAGLVVARLLPDGAPDPTFGKDGVSAISFSVDVFGVAVAGGRILVAVDRVFSGMPGVFAFSADGSLDTSYGARGFAGTKLTKLTGMAVTPDGGVLLADSSRVAKVSAAGQLLSMHAVVNHPNRVSGLVVQPDGKFVVLHEDPLQNGASLKRFNVDGSNDETFYSAAWLTMSPVITDPSAILRLADGRFVVGGRVTTSTGQVPPSPDLVLAGFRPDGWLDTTFGAGGATRMPVGGVASVVALMQQDDGKIVSVFRTDEDPNVDAIGLARYLPDGSFDPSFGADGVLTVAGVEPVAATPTSNGKFLVTGRAGFDLAVVRAVPTYLGPPGTYHPVTPVRILDTRSGVGAPAAKMGPDSTLALQVSGRGVPRVGASAVVLNVTVTGPTALSFLAAWPAGQPRPLVANLNFTPGETTGNLVVAKLGVGGAVSLYNLAGSAHVVADLAGWYGFSGARYTSVPAARVLDTRSGLGAPSAKLGPASTLGLKVTGQGGVPATGVSAVVMNLTATDPSAAGYLTASPAGVPLPLAANLTYVAGQTVSNLVIVKVGQGGVVDLFNSAGSVNLVADVAGWYGLPGASEGVLYTAVAPARILDTRFGGSTSKLGPGETLSFQVTGAGLLPASGVSAVLLNVTVTAPTAPAFLAVWPTGQSRPLAANLTYTAGATRPNVVVVKVGAGGNVSFYNSAGTVHLIVDTAGWYSV